MKTKLILTTGIIGGLGLLVVDGARSQTPAAPLAAEDIVKIEAQEFSRSLAQLKIQEVALQRATSVDEKALALNRAQQSALEQKINELVAAPAKLELQRLESEKDRLANDLRPAHPKMIALQTRIDQLKETLAPDH